MADGLKRERSNDDNSSTIEQVNTHPTQISGQLSANDRSKRIDLRKMVWHGDSHHRPNNRDDETERVDGPSTKDITKHPKADLSGLSRPK
jgi:hypothetical protein